MQLLTLYFFSETVVNELQIKLWWLIWPVGATISHQGKGCVWVPSVTLLFCVGLARLFLSIFFPLSEGKPAL